MKLNVLIYCLKIWLMAVFASPVLIMLTKYVFTGINLPSVLFLYFVAVLLGTAFSLVSVAALWIVTYGLMLSKLSYFKQKLTLSVAAFVLTVMALFIVLAGLTRIEAYCVAAVYYGFVLFGIWFYELEPSKRSSASSAEL